MKNHTQETGIEQVQVCVTDQVEQYTQYAGTLALADVWRWMGVPQVFARAGIRYGTQDDRAPEFGFVLTTGPLLRATSIRRIAQRFGGEPSKESLEADELLRCLVSQSPKQRQLSRFVNTERYEWEEFHHQRVRQLQRIPMFAPHRKGVIIVDDFPLPKPYAKEMTYLTSIWDNNLKRSVPGYAVVHLYYHHPHRPGYSLYAEPWLKTSMDGSTTPKPKEARRRAKPGEERSKLDIALDALEAFLPEVESYEAVVFDSWYTARWFCCALTHQDVPWIGDASANQKFEVGSHYLTVPEIFAAYRTRKRRVKGCKRRVQAVAIPAVMRKDQYTKEDQPVMLVLVTGLTKPRDKDKGYKILVCNQLHWTVRRILRVFGCRPRIEQVHRDGKQHAGWNDFHTRSLDALKCHCALALLRSDLLTLLGIWFPPCAEYSLAEVNEHVIAHVARLTINDVTGQIQVHLDARHPILAFCT
jgi:hypothetical protein